MLKSLQLNKGGLGFESGSLEIKGAIVESLDGFLHESYETRNECRRVVQKVRCWREDFCLG